MISSQISMNIIILKDNYFYFFIMYFWIQKKNLMMKKYIWDLYGKLIKILFTNIYYLLDSCLRFNQTFKKLKLGKLIEI